MTWCGMIGPGGCMQSADFVLGFDAQWCGVPVSDCPYDRVFDPVRWLEWRRGWMCGLSMEDGSKVHYEDDILRSSVVVRRQDLDEVDADPQPQPVVLPPFPLEEPDKGFKPPGETWRDDRNDPPEGEWDRERWKEGPQG